VVNLTSMEP